MKFFGLTLGLVALVSADFSEIIADTLDECIQKNCKTEYEKCKKTNGCEALLLQCSNTCGQKIDQSCWTTCLMKKPLMIGTTSAIANCAVKTGCITNSAETEEDLVEIAIEVIDKLLRKE